MTTFSSDSLLKSALEKIVYFEARVDQLNNDGVSVKSALERSQVDLSQASQREIELRRVVAELEVRVTRAHAEKEDLARVVDALKRERAELIQKMLDASRIHQAGAPSELDDFDLAQFISTLRQEVVHPGQTRAVAMPVIVKASAPLNPLADPSLTAAAAGAQPETPVENMARQLDASGRLRVSSADVQALTGSTPFAGITDETLFGFSVRELSALDDGSRIRAAERLTALGHAAAAPALAAALNVEHVASVQTALLAALASVAKKEALPVVMPHLTSSYSDVRIAALKALLALDVSQAGPHISAAMKDPDRAVRRRASLLALSLTGAQAFELGQLAMSDQDADVRALAALVLGASGAEAARPLLLAAMKDRDEKVRRSASQAWSRHLGTDVTAVVRLDEAQRRREVRRIASLPVGPRAAETRAVVVAPVVQKTEQLVARRAEPKHDQQLVKSKIVAELRAAIRGKPLDDLAHAVGLSARETEAVVEELVMQGAAVRRGAKVYVG